MRFTTGSPGRQPGVTGITGRQCMHTAGASRTGNHRGSASADRTQAAGRCSTATKMTALSWRQAAGHSLGPRLHALADRPQPGATRARPAGPGSAAQPRARPPRRSPCPVPRDPGRVRRPGGSRGGRARDRVRRASGRAGARFLRAQAGQPDPATVRWLTSPPSGGPWNGAIPAVRGS